MFFSLVFLIFLLQTQRIEKGWHQWEEEGDVVKKCVHMLVNAKMIPIETTPGIFVGGMVKENGRGGEFMYDIFSTL
jgi:hypothetical protein